MAASWPRVHAKQAGEQGGFGEKVCISAPGSSKRAPPASKLGSKGVRQVARCRVGDGAVGVLRQVPRWPSTMEVEDGLSQ